MNQIEMFNEIMNLRNELLSAKNLIDQSPEVKTSRRLQGAITKCSVLLDKLNKELKDVASTNTASEQTVSN